MNGTLGGQLAILGGVILDTPLLFKPNDLDVVSADLKLRWGNERVIRVRAFMARHYQNGKTMKVNLKGMKRKELEKLAADVEKALQNLAKEDLKKAREAAEKAAKAHGFSLADIAGGPAKKAAPKKPVKKVAPKYAHPENPEMTWTGRGRRPRWVEEVTKGGKDISEFLINKA